MFCTNCGNQLLEDSRFCCYCGAEVTVMEDAFSPLTENELIEAYNQGCYYYSGSKGYALDYDKAYNCFSLAAEQDYVAAINYLGVMHLNGQGAEQDSAKAIEFFARAITLNPEFGHGYYNIGHIYFTGRGVSKNYDIALDYLLKSIEYGKGMSYYAYACHYVGYIYMEYKSEPQRSISYFSEAVTDGQIGEAWNNLGILHHNGVYTDTEHPAYYYFEKGAELGCTAAMESAGRLLLIQAETATHEEKTELETRAKAWLEKASKAGSATATQILRNCGWA